MGFDSWPLFSFGEGWTAYGGIGLAEGFLVGSELLNHFHYLSYYPAKGMLCIVGQLFKIIGSMYRRVSTVFFRDFVLSCFTRKYQE